MAATGDAINTRFSPLPSPARSSAAALDLDEPPWSADESRRGRSQLQFPALVGPGASEAVNGAVPPASRSPSSRVKTRRSSSNKSTDNVQRLNAAEMKHLTSSPDSLPIAPAPQRRSIDQEMAAAAAAAGGPEQAQTNGELPGALDGLGVWQLQENHPRPYSQRTLSTPPTTRVQHAPRESASHPATPRRFSHNPSLRPPPLVLSVNGGAVNGIASASASASANANAGARPPSPTAKTSSAAASAAQTPASTPSQRYVGPSPPSPIPPVIPLPPMSIPTHLQLELAAQRPSPLYIHQSRRNDAPYESYAVKLDRLKNVLLLPSYLERTLYFGALACLDAWLYTFTILPIRFFIALGIVLKWWAYLVTKEVKWLCGFVRTGLRRLWQRGRPVRSRRPSVVSVSVPDESQVLRSASQAREASGGNSGQVQLPKSKTPLPQQNGNSRGAPASAATSKTGAFRHPRTTPVPSSLSAFHKADLLQGTVIICSSFALMTLDASRMYHFIRAQSAIKLYVIYNILEVGDRLLSALGQDILECLFSDETLSRDHSGRSKVLVPFGIFLLTLAYTCTHSIALYYQVITLNVAVNSYSNALLTLLLSNQFVEIKSTVFKRIEKENLFQLVCADIVERFHLWIMLLIIGMRNLVEVGALSVPGAGFDSYHDDGTAAVPLHPPSILPHSFTVLPSWFKSGEALSPFLIVVGSEMLVDTIKHAYVTKFNNIKPTFYGRTLDILCKDYYTNAFVTPSLTRRLGLAVIPLSCLFIRASIQTYHMFLSTHVPMPLPPSTQTSLSEESAVPSSPAVMAALSRFDALIRDSLGRATYGYPYGSPLNSRPWYAWTSDDSIAALTMVVVFFIVFLVLLILKLLLGMLLLQYARTRYAKMKQKEHLVALGKADRESFNTLDPRMGGLGHVQVTQDKARWINADKDEGPKNARRPPGSAQSSEFMGVGRYEMIAKRIW